MEDVFRFLSLNLGVPPTEFEWRHEKRNNSKGGKKKGVRQDRLTALKKYTPQSFFQQTVGLELSDYHCLFHAPDRPFGKHYLFEEQYCAVGADEMNLLGQGTERVEAELEAALPGVRVERLDRDTTRRRGTQQALLERFRAGEVDVGTRHRSPFGGQHRCGRRSDPRGGPCHPRALSV